MSNNGMLQPKMKDETLGGPLALTIRSGSTQAVSAFKKDSKDVDKYEYVQSALEAEYNEEIKNDS